MIRYSLKCSDGHQFESWFQSADAYDALAAKGLVSCAVCGGQDVSKAIMAPRVTTKEDATRNEGATPPQKPADLRAPSSPTEQMLNAMRAHLKKNSTYVGGNFAKEARAMHLGEAQERPIHGEANAQEAKALIEDGIPIAPLPIIPTDKTN